MGTLTTRWGDIVSFRDDDVTKEAMFDAVLKFFVKHQQFSGEGVSQSDGPQLDSPELLGELADEILCFKTEHKEE